jgi:hypothetical protein
MLTGYHREAVTFWDTLVGDIVQLKGQLTYEDTLLPKEEDVDYEPEFMIETTKKQNSTFKERALRVEL